MKKIALLSSIFLLSLTVWASNSFADCQSAMKDAANKAKKDKKCQGDAKKAAKAFAKQIQICKAFRALKRSCRKAKKACKKSARKIKRACTRACKKKCKFGRKGKACRKAKRACKRNCRKAKRASKRICRKSKRACKRAAKQTPAFAVCKSARKLTRKALGNGLKCFGKYFIKPALICVGELLRNK